MSSEKTEIFFIRRKSLWCKDLGRRGWPLSRKSLWHKDLRQIREYGVEPLTNRPQF